jgi:hypothetical protein
LTPSERDALKRGAVAWIPMVFPFWVLRTTGDPSWATLAAIPCIGVFAFILMPSLSAACGERATDFLYRPGYCEKPRAPLSLVDKLALNEEWDAAELMLVELARRYPDDPAVWPRLFRVVWLRLDDRERAREAHELLLSVDDDPVRWERQTHMYLLLAEERLGDGAEFKAELSAALSRVEAARRQRELGRHKRCVV